MPVTHRLITFFSRYGAPVKFAVKQLMPVLLPGSPAVAELVVELFDCVHESATDNQRFEAGDLPDASDAAEIRTITRREKKCHKYLGKSPDG